MGESIWGLTRAVPGHCTMKTKLKCDLTLKFRLKTIIRLINEYPLHYNFLTKRILARFLLILKHTLSVPYST